LSCATNATRFFRFKIFSVMIDSKNEFYQRKLSINH